MESAGNALILKVKFDGFSAFLLAQDSSFSFLRLTSTQWKVNFVLFALLLLFSTDPDGLFLCSRIGRKSARKVAFNGGGYKWGTASRLPRINAHLNEWNAFDWIKFMPEIPEKVGIGTHRK